MGHEHKIDLKVILLLLLSFVVLLVSLSFYLFMNSKDIIIKPNPVCNFRDEVYLEDYIYKLDGTLRNNYKIDTRKVGRQEVKAIYQDKNGFYKAKRFIVTVKDKKAPTILVSGDYTVERGFTGKLENKIFCADDYDDRAKCVINGSYNLDEVGVYPLSITAIDKSGNRSKKSFNLRVVPDDNDNDNNKKEPSIGTVMYSDIYKKYKNDHTMVGIDISRWQKDVDFEKLKKNNVEFIFIKMASQKEKNGKIVLDPKFEENIKKAIAYKFKVGLYFFSYAKTPLEAKRQAKFVVKNIKNYNIELPIVFDWEDWENFNSYKISLNKLNNIASAFIKEVEIHNYSGMIYSSKYYLDNVWFLEDYEKIWVANYGELLDKDRYNYWQLCSDGMVEGINTLVDIDVMFNQ